MRRFTKPKPPGGIAIALQRNERASGLLLGGMAKVLAALLVACFGHVFADAGLTPAQQRMRACNTQAKQKGLEARERSRFITDCLNGRKGSRPLTPIQARNEACTREADERKLEGAERRGFMSDCTKPERVKQQTADRVKVRNCNRRAEARRLDGEEKKKFVAGCLDGSRVVIDG